jgi:hypothetical protein
MEDTICWHDRIICDLSFDDLIKKRRRFGFLWFAFLATVTGRDVGRPSADLRYPSIKFVLARCLASHSDEL